MTEKATILGETIEVVYRRIATVLAQQPSILAARDSRPSPARSAAATSSSVK